MCCCLTGYNAVRFLFRIIVRIFFRDITVIGTDNIPKSGPVIFTGNHQNQFVDAMLLVTNVKEKVGFLCAEKSMKRFGIGHGARAMNAIPVKRPQDVPPEAGIGTVKASGTRVTGKATSFMEQVGPGDLVVVPGCKKKPRVLEVLSDTELNVSEDFDGDVSNSTFKLVKKVDQSGMFEAVYDRLKDGGCVGIFPEGGSHDRTELLPLKAGVAIMAMGAVNKFNLEDLKIIPCGLNYFHGSKFRSQVVVEFGKPIEISPELLATYKKDKREACNSLLQNVEKGLRSVTLNIPTYEEQQLLFMARRLYQPEGMKLAPEQYMELNRRFAAAYSKLGDNPRVIVLKAKIKEYRTQLKSYGLSDYQIAVTKSHSINPLWALIVFLYRLVKMLVLLALGIPGAILGLPIVLITSVMAAKEQKKALAASSVKVAARDVIASYKILVAMVFVPLLYTVYCITTIVLMTKHSIPHPEGMHQQTWAAVLPIVVCLSLPFITYASVRLLEEDFALIQSLGPLIWMTLSPSKKKEALYAMRSDVQTDIRHLVEMLGPQVLGDEWENRIITPDDMYVYSELMDVSLLPMKRRDTHGIAV